MIALDLTNPSRLILDNIYKIPFDKFDYIVIDLKQDYLINNLLGKNYVNIIEKINTLDDLDTTLEFNNLFLNRNIDSYLFKYDFEKLKQNKNLLKEIPQKGVFNINNTEDLENYYELFEEYPDLIEISVCPLEYPKEIIDFCKENNIKVIGSNIFGDKYNEPYVVEVFSRNYLLNFSKHNVDIFEIPSNNVYNIDLYLEYKDNDISYYLGSEIHKLPINSSKVKTIIKTYIDIDPDIKNLLITNKDEPVSKMSPKILETEYLESEDTNLQKEASEWIFPEDMNISDVTCFLRYYSKATLDKFYTTKIWKTELIELPGNLLRINLIPKTRIGIFFKRHSFLAFFNEITRKMHLREL